MTLWLGLVDFVNDTSKELTKENSPVDRELTAPPFLVAPVVMEKEFVFCQSQRSMLNTAYSVKAFEPRLN